MISCRSVFFAAACALANLAVGVASLTDRKLPASRAVQDAALHASIFAAAVYAMHRYGHLLAV